jgi:hypothetical protein
MQSLANLYVAARGLALSILIGGIDFWMYGTVPIRNGLEFTANWRLATSTGLVFIKTQFRSIPNNIT